MATPDTYRVTADAVATAHRDIRPRVLLLTQSVRRTEPVRPDAHRDHRREGPTLLAYPTGSGTLFGFQPMARAMSRAIVSSIAAL
jgi:hypothetical protein